MALRNSSTGRHLAEQRCRAAHKSHSRTLRSTKLHQGGGLAARTTDLLTMQATTFGH
jgi:hypothetical protein